MSKSPLNFIIIGCGGITEAHLLAFENHPDRVRLSVVCDQSDLASHTVAERFKNIAPAKTYSDFEEAIRNERSNIDSALITTPHFLHFTQAKTCVEAGIPALVEKPICNNLSEAQQLLELSEANNVLLVAGQNRRYASEARWLRRWLDEKPEEFGELRSFDMRGWQNIEAWIATKSDKNADFWALDKERAGGGVVLSLMIHYIDLIRYLSGLDYVEAQAHGRIDAPFKNGAESTCCALLKMSNGAVGTLHGNFLARKTIQPNEIFSMIGENGYIGNTNGWQYASMNGDAPDGWDHQFKNIQDVPNDDPLSIYPGSFITQLLAFADAVEKGETLMSSIADNFNTIATVEAIYESMKCGGQAVAVKKR